MIKTVIGSFPTSNLPVHDLIKMNLNLQLKYGIDIVSDGEPRADMIEYFYQIPGLVRLNRGLRIGGKIEPMNNPSEFIKLQDLKYAQSYLKELNKNDVAIKTAVTGPITLGLQSAINGVEYYNGIKDHRIYSDLADAIQPLIIELLKNGSLVQIDEPALSARFMHIDKAVNIINSMVDDIPSQSIDKVSMHICGTLSKELFNGLLKIHLPTLSLAFSSPSEESNIHIISKEKVEEYGVKIGVGCVSVLAVRESDVDSVDKIVNRLRTIMNILGEENIRYIHPDCGLRNTPLPVAERILENLSISAKFF
ncbi:MAG: hypothetical protein RMJ31_01635 [Nitrososphaerota archaeon]|nr:hypothetical protein [Nitrososphaerales archaeon]MDW8044462.1 hypothetical protein [Nitrososphaerota archaeon]